MNTFGIIVFILMVGLIIFWVASEDLATWEMIGPKPRSYPVTINMCPPQAIVRWLAPEGAAYYKGFMSNDSAKIATYPLRCREFRVPPPLKAGEPQHAVIKYIPEKFTYTLYVEIFAFDINGNYWNVELITN